MTSNIYRHAEYYEIAFGFVNPRTSVDTLEAFIREHSKIEVRTVLDICCGPALQLREFARRGYQAIGLDCSEPMLQYLRRKADEEHVNVETVNADMTDFDLDTRVDFSYIMMGSFIYVKDTPGLLSHLSSVARALKPGGLYLIENLSIDWVSPESWTPVTWVMERDGVRVQTTYQKRLTNALEQTIQQVNSLEIDDHGTQLQVTDCDDLKLIMPQELRAIVELHGQFEFLGFFERESINPLRKLAPDNIALLRKR